MPAAASARFLVAVSLRSEPRSPEALEVDVEVDVDSVCFVGLCRSLNRSRHASSTEFGSSWYLAYISSTSHSFGPNPDLELPCWDGDTAGNSPLLLVCAAVCWLLASVRGTTQG